MPGTGRKCQVPMCRTGLKEDNQWSNPNRQPTVFQFKKEPVVSADIAEAWVRFCTVKGHKPQVHDSAGICEKHFEVKWLKSVVLPHGDVPEGKRMRLERGAYPTIYPKELGINVPSVREPRPHRMGADERGALAAEHTRRAHEEWEEADRIRSKADLIEILRETRLSRNVMYTADPEDCEFLIISHSMHPRLSQFTVDVTVRIGLGWRLDINVGSLPLPKSKVSRYADNRQRIVSRSKFRRLLADLPVMHTAFTTKELLTEQQHLVNDAVENADTDMADGDGYAAAMIAGEQLRNALVAPRSRRYSDHFISVAAIIKKCSPSAYAALQSCGFILPSGRTMLTTCAFFVPELGFSDRNVQYLKDRIKNLDDRERLVALTFDEVHLSSRLELEGGKIYGIAEGTDKKTKDGSGTAVLATTLFAVGLHSVAGSYEDLYVLVPEANLTGLRVEQYVRRALAEVQSVGFTVTALLADHHQTNQLFFRSLNDPDSNSEWPERISNPTHDGKFIYVLFDVVHGIKLIYNSFINRRVLRVPGFGPDESAYVADVADLEAVHEFEHSKVTRMAQHLSHKTLHPMQIEKTSFKLAYAVFNEKTVEALNKYSSLEAFKNRSAGMRNTARFVECMSNLIKVINVSSELSEDRKLDQYRAASVGAVGKGEANLDKYAAWFRAWVEDVTVELPPQHPKGRAHAHGSPRWPCKPTDISITAMYHTLSGMASLSRYLYREHGIKRRFLKKFNSDKIEKHFSLLRSRAGCGYAASALELLHAEGRTRVMRLAKATRKLKVLGKDPDHMAIGDREREEDLETAAWLRSVVKPEQCAVDETDRLLNFLLSGYIWHQLRKRKVCADCMNWLAEEVSDLAAEHMQELQTGMEGFHRTIRRIMGEEVEMETWEDREEDEAAKEVGMRLADEDKEFLDTISRGGLRYPPERMFGIVTHARMFSQFIWDDPSIVLRFSQSHSPVTVYLTAVMENIREMQTEATCSKGHSVMDVIRKALRITFNTTTKGATGIYNDTAHLNRKRQNKMNPETGETIDTKTKTARKQQQGKH